MKYLVTGGSGFIASHIVDHLMEQNHEVIVYDNFSTGREIFTKLHQGKPNFELVKADLRDVKILNEKMKGVDFVFHLAAHADVRSGFQDHVIDHEENLEMTQNVLEAMHKNEVKNIAFASTSSVYGDATIHPTPEEYQFEPTSLYGATKAAAESYIRVYASYYGMRSFIFRFVSFIGERYTHGIMVDILKKLYANPKEIELFSDGSPRKSSLYVKDGVAAIFKIIETSKDQFNVYNIGHDEVLQVKDIVETIIKEAGYNDVKLNWLGKGSNWKGDNEFVHLKTDKLKALGWKPSMTIKEGIAKTIKYLQENKELFS